METDARVGERFLSAFRGEVIVGAAMLSICAVAVVFAKITIPQTAHKIKGIAAEIGARKLAAIAKELERSASEGRCADSGSAALTLAHERFAVGGVR